MFEWSELTVLRLIGAGSYGRVYLATWRATPVAAKVLLTDDVLSDSAAALEQLDALTRQLLVEAHVMSAMRHPNLVNFMGVCLLPPCILTEHCSRGSLYDVLSQGARDPALAAELTWQRRLAMVRRHVRPSMRAPPGAWPTLAACDIRAPRHRCRPCPWVQACDAARGLLYLHVSSPPVVHKDVKSPNVLVDQNWSAKVRPALLRSGGWG